MEIIKMYLEKLKEKEPTLNERLYKNIYDEILCLSSLYSNNITKELEFKFKFSDIMYIINIVVKLFDFYDPIFVTSEQNGIKKITELADIILSELKIELL